MEEINLTAMAIQKEEYIQEPGYNVKVNVPGVVEFEIRQEGRIVRKSIKTLQAQLKVAEPESNELEIWQGRSLPDVIQSADLNQPKQFLNVLQLVRDVPTYSQAAVVYSSLYDKMKSKNLDSYQSMMLAYAIEENMDFSNYPNIEQSYKDKFEFLRSVLEDKRKEGVKVGGELIRKGEYDNALSWEKTFNSCGSGFELALPDLVKSAYANDLNNFEMVLKFIRNLPYIEDRPVGLKALHDEMKLNKHLEKFQLMMLAYAVKETMAMEKYSTIEQSYKDRFEFLKRELEEKSNALLLECATQVRNGFYEKILAWEKKINTFGSSFELALPDIIKSAYSNTLDNFENVLKFIRDLLSVSRSAVALSALYDEMKANDHLECYQLMMLAYAVKEYMQMKVYADIQQCYKDKLEQIRDDLPNNVRNFIWSERKKCTIKNVQYKEYMYCPSILYNYGLTMRYAYTWKLGNIEEDCYWSIQTPDKGKTFTFMNTYTSMFLYSSDWIYDNNRRFVFFDTLFRKFEKISYWKITPKSNGKFLISSEGYKDEEFMFVGEYAWRDERRRVLTWSSDPKTIASEWEIEFNN